MEWLAMIGLAIWVAVQGRRIRKLEDALTRAARTRSPDPVAAVLTAPAIVRERDPAVVAAPAPFSTESAPPPAPVADFLDARGASHAPIRRPVWARPEIAAPKAAQPPRAPPRPPRVSVSAWLAENGLAWLGGGGLMLGGLFLAVYAAQRGVFTPPLRIAAAVAVGGSMIGASEWIRRRPDTSASRHMLVSSLLAGAGAATLYGAIWAALSLYALIPFASAAVLIAAVSLGLLAVAFLHGEPLAILAMAGAFAAPVVTGLAHWTPVSLESFLVAIAMTGFAAASLRRWGGAGLVTIAGLSLWILVALSRQHLIGASLLMLLQVSLALASVCWDARHGGAERAPQESPDTFAWQPIVALLASSLLTFFLWGNLGKPFDHAHFAVCVIVSAALVALGGATVRFGRVAPGYFAIPIVATVLGVVLCSLIGMSLMAFFDQALLFTLIVCMAGAALVFGLGSATTRTVMASAGAVGAAVLANWAWLWPGGGHPALTWALPALATLALALGAVWLARGSQAPQQDNALAIWIAATAELLFLSVHACVIYGWAPLAHAGVALGLALLARRLRWRGLPRTSVAGGLVVIATLLRPALIEDLLRGRLSQALYVAVVTGSVLLLLAAWRILRRDPAARPLADAQASLALLTALVGAFFLLHIVLTGGHGVERHLDLLEASLRTLLLLATGLALALRHQPDAGPIARWRLILVLAAGVAHGVILQVALLNPWWGYAEPVEGPLLVNFLAPAFLAPAGLLWIVARREVAGLPWIPRAAWALAFGWTFLWLILEIRHAFHGAFLAAGETSRTEFATYALALPLVARVLYALRMWGPASDPAGPTATIARAAAFLAWPAIGISALFLCLYASPWWGPLAAPIGSPAEALLLFVLYLAGAIATMSLSRVAGGEAWRVLAASSATAATLELFVLATLLVRWAFRGETMRAPVGEIGAETWAYSAVWAVFGLISLIIGTVRSSPTVRWLGLVVLLGTVAKVLLVDMAHLDGVVRAASFLAVGALLIVGALAARRLNASRS